MATDIDSGLQFSQPLIKELKKNIPQYYMQAMN